VSVLQIGRTLVGFSKPQMRFPEGRVVANRIPVLEDRLAVLGGSKVAIASLEMTSLGYLWIARACSRGKHDEDDRQDRQLSQRHGE
jgi:hypothetical protein